MRSGFDDAGGKGLSPKSVMLHRTLAGWVGIQ